MSVHDTAFVCPEQWILLCESHYDLKNFLSMILISVCSMLVVLRKEVLYAWHCAKPKVRGPPSSVCFLYVTSVQMCSRENVNQSEPSISAWDVTLFWS